METSTQTYQNTPVSVVFAGTMSGTDTDGNSTVADLMPETVQVSENKQTIHAMDGSETTIPVGPGSIQLSGILGVGENMKSIVDRLTDEDVSLTLTNDEEGASTTTFSNCTCVNSQVQITGGEQGVVLKGSITYKYEVDNAYTPLQIYFSGGRTVDLYVMNLAVSEQKVETSFINNTEKGMIVSPGQLQLSGIVVEPGEFLASEDNLLTALGTEVASIKIGGTDTDGVVTDAVEYTGCICVSTNLSTAGAENSATHLQGQITYQYEVARLASDIQYPTTITIVETDVAGTEEAEVDKVLSIPSYVKQLTITHPDKMEIKDLNGTYRDFNAGPGQIQLSGIMVGGDPGDILNITPGTLSNIKIDGTVYKSVKCVSNSTGIQGQDHSSTFLSGKIDFTYAGEDLNDDFIQVETVTVGDGETPQTFAASTDIFVQTVQIQKGSPRRLTPGEGLKETSPGSITLSGLIISADLTADLGSSISIRIGGTAYNCTCLGADISVKGNDRYYHYHTGTLKYAFDETEQTGEEFTREYTEKVKRTFGKEHIVVNGIQYVRFTTYKREDAITTKALITTDSDNIADIGLGWADDYIESGYKRDMSNPNLITKYARYMTKGDWEIEEQFDVEVV